MPFFKSGYVPTCPSALSYISKPIRTIFTCQHTTAAMRVLIAGCLQGLVHGRKLISQVCLWWPMDIAFYACRFSILIPFRSYFTCRHRYTKATPLSIFRGGGEARSEPQEHRRSLVFRFGSKRQTEHKLEVGPGGADPFPEAGVLLRKNLKMFMSAGECSCILVLKTCRKKINISSAYYFICVPRQPDLMM